MINKIKKLFGLGWMPVASAIVSVKIAPEITSARIWANSGRIYLVQEDGTSKKLSLDSKVYPGDKIFLRKSNGVRNIKTVK